jgi:glucose-1-phosphate cytidylyltransferase
LGRFALPRVKWTHRSLLIHCRPLSVREIGGLVKVMILAGGAGTRLSEETETRPKPMVEIGGQPILWHIMRLFDHYGFDHFLVALGYKGGYIKRFFSEYHTSAHSLRVELKSGRTITHGDGEIEQWTVDLIETGTWTNTGGRIKRLAAHIPDETFFLAWGDGVFDVDLRELLSFHRSHGKFLTVTAVHPPPRFGQLVLDGSSVLEFTEKPIDSGWINGGLFVCEPEVLDYIDDDDTQFEKDPMERLAKDGQLMAFRHEGFWQCMDTLRDKVLLNRLWDAGDPPWRVWS